MIHLVNYGMLAWFVCQEAADLQTKRSNWGWVSHVYIVTIHAHYFDLLSLLSPESHTHCTV